MKKIRKYILVLALFAGCFLCGSLLAEKKTLHDDLIRLHVVANSDSQEDQEIKLQVRDAVTAYLQPAMEKVTDTQQAKSYLEENLTQIEALANETLETLGSADRAKVRLKQEEFDTRVYDTFTLPAGVYESLRIEIGDGEGKNWWCVVFPSLCIPATTQDFQVTAAASGFDETLTNTLTGEEGYEIRFFLLDCLGKLENFLHKN